jgi:hypothetical protein
MTLTPPLAGDESARCRDRWLLDGGLHSRPKGCCLKRGQTVAVERPGAPQTCTVAHNASTMQRLKARLFFMARLTSKQA